VSVRARALVEAQDAQRVPALWIDPVGRARRVTPVVGTGITLPSASSASSAPSGASAAGVATGSGAEADAGQPLVLLGAWTNPFCSAPTEFWVSNLHSVGPPALFAMAKLARRVHGDFARIAVPLGIRDFEGRSYRGWHHHATLVSVAHAIAATSEAGSRPAPQDVEGVLV